MPVRVIGMIGVAPPQGATLHVIAGGISPGFIVEFARAHEAAGFDMALVGYHAASAEGFQVAAHAAAHTERLSYLIAHRPGIAAPTLAARAAATLDVVSGGRIALHIIAGLSDAEQQAEGDFLPKDDRYRRATEYLSIMRRLWTAPAPFDHEGEFYRLKAAFSAAKPVQRPHPPLFFGGSSDGAFAMGAEQCDVFAMYGEPLAETAERIADFRRRVAALGRPAPRFNMSFRPILAPTEGAAWDKARRILAELQAAGGLPTEAQDRSAARILSIAARGEVHDERLWMPIAVASAAKGNTTCLVGTAEQVAQAMLRYYRLGVHSFLIRGFDPMADAAEYGRELIPRLREGAAAIDAERAAAE
jgi:alkanesulfonate monooxygenase